MMREHDNGRFDNHRRKAVWGVRVRLAVALTAAAMLTSCGNLTTQGQAASYLIITSLTGASGATPGTLSNVVASVVSALPPVFSDPGSVSFQLALKDAGGVGSPTTPTSNNFITIDSYHVEYVRTDGRNVQGVDVPYAFDGGLTGTVTNTLSLGFTLVRSQAKEEAPLKTLSTGSGAIVLSTIAKVTFYGHDQTGRQVSVTGNIGVNFAGA